MHHRVLRRSPFGAVCCALVLSCGGGEGTALVERQAVLGGERTGDSHAGTLYVVSEIRNVGGRQVTKIGSGALVAPNLLATALHVVSRNPSNVPFTCDANGDVVSGSSGASLGTTVAPEKISVYAGPNPTGDALAHGLGVISTGSATICQNDLAFVVLDRALDLPTYTIHRGPPVAVGDSVSVVGYGTGLDAASERGVRNERQVSVTSVGQWIRTFTVTAGPCAGDSGGPALGASGELVGIFSTVAVDCAGPSAAPKYTDLSYFERLVERAFDEASAGSPWTVSGQGGAGGQGPTSEAGMAGAGGEPTSPEPTSPRVDRAEAGCAVVNRKRSNEAGLALILAGTVLCRRMRRREEK